jgi:3-hydroxyacyl-[acyl-carrier-protein] dehydratase
MELNCNEILEYQCQVYPFLLIDHADEIIPGVSARGYKYLNMSDWFFKYHYPGDPLVPGIFLVEAIGQMATLAIVTMPGLKGKRMYLAGLQRSKCYTQVRPAVKMIIDTKIIKYTRGVAHCEGVCVVDGETACDAELTFVVPDVLNQYKVAGVGSRNG